MDTPEEVHAFVIGLCEILAPWPPRIRTPSPSKGEGKGEGDNPDSVVRKEYHYYSFGRASGFITLMFFCIGIAKIIQAVFF